LPSVIRLSAVPTKKPLSKPAVTGGAAGAGVCAKAGAATVKAIRKPNGRNMNSPQ
jgi:hypothetical protein